MPKLAHRKYESLAHRLNEHMRIVRKIEAELNAILERSRPAGCSERDWEIGTLNTVSDDDSVHRVCDFPNTLTEALIEIARNGGEVKS